MLVMALFNSILSIMKNKSTRKLRLTFLKTPDYESPHDTGLNNIYKIDIEASAGLDITPQSILIKVEDAIEGRVVDGPLVGARVFIDNNDNSILDSDEKSAITNSEGFFYINKNTLIINIVYNKISN